MTTTVAVDSFSPAIIPLHTNRHTGSCLTYTIVFLILFAFLKLRGKGLLSLLFAVVAKKKKYEVIQDDGIIPHLADYMMALLLSFSAIAIGITFMICGEVRFDMAAILFGVLLLYHFLVITLVRFISWTFNSASAGEEITINMWVYHICGGLVAAPFVIATFFVRSFAVPLLLNLVIATLVIVYLAKMVRWCKILWGYRVPLFFLILYLCAFEITPLLIIAKLLVR